MEINVNDLQQLAEAHGGAATLEWSTVSHTHGGTVALDPQSATLSITESAKLIRKLQELPQPDGASVLEWSTVSHTHGGPK